jgi:hypothetical protein
MGSLKLASVFELGEADGEVRGGGVGGGFVIGAKIFLASENKGMDVAAVKTGDDGLGFVDVLDRKDVCFHKFTIHRNLCE